MTSWASPFLEAPPGHSPPPGTGSAAGVALFSLGFPLILQGAPSGQRANVGLFQGPGPEEKRTELLTVGSQGL